MANPEHDRILRESARTGDRSVDMSGYDLSGLRFASIQIAGLKLAGANLSGADLSGGKFCDCDLRNARLQKARFGLGDFRNANLSGADLTGCYLNGAVMTGVNLTNAILTRANLVKTRLNRADLTGANLKQTDLRGAEGLTAQQLATAVNSEQAILDERQLAELGRKGDVTLARHGRQTRKKETRHQVDLMFESVKPGFGDVFLLCGREHPDFPPTRKFRFDELADLQIEQVDDYFAICADGDPVVWVFPLVGGRVVEHHRGPFDGLRIELEDRAYKKLWSKCVARFQATLPIVVSE